jgi:choline dehydrogenase-like flavoprotein
LDSWKAVSGMDFFSTENLKPYYDIVDETIISQEISPKYRNRNAEIFEQGFKNNGYKCAPLIRAQKDCKSEAGNDCIECLAGCKIDSKQSMPVTVLKTAIEQGLKVIPDFEVLTIQANDQGSMVSGVFTNHEKSEFRAKKIILAAGAIGNSKILLQSGFKSKMIGKNFYTHPQHMILARYDEVVNSHKGTFQAFKSSDPNFRKAGFKLENVFAPPVAIAMLLPGIGKKHRNVMEKMDHLACIEVAIRDTHPGTIKITKSGKPIIDKRANAEDKLRLKKGTEAINNIFTSTGAKEIIPGIIPIGLHLMGGCGIGVDPEKSVTSPCFCMHENKNIFIADSSIFPNAPGINPSMTIMAISIKASEEFLRQIK